MISPPSSVGFLFGSALIIPHLPREKQDKNEKTLKWMHERSAGCTNLRKHGISLRIGWKDFSFQHLKEGGIRENDAY
jgi:hypothetical protein